jgi:hypothetical protein
VEEEGGGGHAYTPLTHFGRFCYFGAYTQSGTLPRAKQYHIACRRYHVCVCTASRSYHGTLGVQQISRGTPCFVLVEPPSVEPMRSTFPLPRGVSDVTSSETHLAIYEIHRYTRQNTRTKL